MKISKEEMLECFGRECTCIGEDTCPNYIPGVICPVPNSIRALIESAVEDSSKDGPKVTMEDIKNLSGYLMDGGEPTVGFIKGWLHRIAGVPVEDGKEGEVKP